MASAPPPTIFSATRRAARRARMEALQARPDAPSYLAQAMAEDVLERLAFLRHEPASTLAIGPGSDVLANPLTSALPAVTMAGPGLDEEAPFPSSGFDLIASLGTLDTVNDLPGALIHIRNALAPGGLMIASFIGAGSLPRLRAAMLAADADRPAARMHPLVDVRAGGQLLQRCGFARPVVDGWGIDVRYSSLRLLVGDLRAQGLGNVLASHAAPLGKAALARAEAAFGRQTAERFEIVTLSGWKP